MQCKLIQTLRLWNFPTALVKSNCRFSNLNYLYHLYFVLKYKFKRLPNENAFKIFVKIHEIGTALLNSFPFLPWHGFSTFSSFLNRHRNQNFQWICTMLEQTTTTRWRQAQSVAVTKPMFSLYSQTRSSQTGSCAGSFWSYHQRRICKTRFNCPPVTTFKHFWPCFPAYHIMVFYCIWSKIVPEIACL